MCVPVDKNVFPREGERERGSCRRSCQFRRFLCWMCVRCASSTCRLSTMTTDECTFICGQLLATHNWQTTSKSVSLSVFLCRFRILFLFICYDPRILLAIGEHEMRNDDTAPDTAASHASNIEKRGDALAHPTDSYRGENFSYWHFALVSLLACRHAHTALTIDDANAFVAVERREHER